MVALVNAAVEAYLRGMLDPSLVQITRHPTQPLVILNYTDRCRIWNDVTRTCRGLILHAETAEVVALPFPKFFNLGEVKDTWPTNLPDAPFSVFEKVDGSLGIFYRDTDSQPRLATRGAFTAPQARKGTQMLHKLNGLDAVPPSLTLLFEIVYPANRVIVDYGQREELVLLGIVNRESGEDLSWGEVEIWARHLGVRVPAVYQFSSVRELMTAKSELPASLEGFVVRFASGLRVKLKGDAYLDLYRQQKGTNRGAIMAAVAAGRLEQYLSEGPEEFHGLTRDIAADITAQATVFAAAVHDYFAHAPKDSSRKDFALWVQSHVPSQYQPGLFQLLDGRTPDWVILSQRA